MIITLIKISRIFLAAVSLSLVVSLFFIVAHAEDTIGNVHPLQGIITYSLDNAELGTWNTTLNPNGPSDPWYSRLEINSDGYSGSVIVTWKLQQKTGSSNWLDVSLDPITTLVMLSGDLQNVYATEDGAYGSANYEWGHIITGSGAYRVVASIVG